MIAASAPRSWVCGLWSSGVAFPHATDLTFNLKGHAINNLCRSPTAVSQALLAADFSKSILSPKISLWILLECRDFL